MVQSAGTIAPDALGRVFDRLYRGSPERSGDGHGLGLAIVKAIADLHGWSVRASSADGAVVFTITL